MRKRSQLGGGLAAAAAILLAGCSAAENQREQQSASSRADRVEVMVWADGPDGASKRTAIECPADKRCTRLNDADFAIPKDEQCAAVYGGPAVATVTGRIGGRAIKTEFSLRDSCAVDRWRRFSWLIGPAPGQ